MKIKKTFYRMLPIFIFLLTTLANNNVAQGVVTVYDNTALDYAEGAMEYLISIAEADGSGYKWKEKNASAATTIYQTGYNKGAAGVGEAFLRLYQTTGNTSYLDYAKGAAQWLMDVAVSEGGGYKWARQFNASSGEVLGGYMTSYYPGAAGIGEFFLDLYEETTTVDYLNYAKGAGDWLIHVANSSFGGYAWPEAQGDVGMSTRWTFGTAGVGSYFILLGKATGTASYHDYAKGAAQWLLETAISENNGYKWKWRYYVNGSTYTDSDIVGRWHGAAGTAWFLMDAGKEYSNDTFTDAAVKALTWVDSVAVVDGGAHKWANIEDEEPQTYITGYSRGPAGVGSTFIKMHIYSEEDSYLTSAEKAYDWLVDVAGVDDGNGGLYWNDSNVKLVPYSARGHGSAGTGLFFLDAFDATGTAKYYEAAEKCATYLENIAIEKNGGYVWTQNSDTSSVHSTIYYGAAGVALYLNLFATTNPNTSSAPGFELWVTFLSFFVMVSVSSILYRRKKL